MTQFEVFFEYRRMSYVTSLRDGKFYYELPVTLDALDRNVYGILAYLTQRLIDQYTHESRFPTHQFPTC